MNGYTTIAMVLIVAAISLFALTVTTIAQTDSPANLPEIGSISDIKGMSRMYLIADGESRKLILKKLGNKSGITVSQKPDEADFFLEYKTLARDHVTSLQLLMETGQIDVYIYRDKKKVIAWSESKVGGGFKGDTPGAIMGKFLKAYKKLASPQK